MCGGLKQAGVCRDLQITQNEGVSPKAKARLGGPGGSDICLRPKLRTWLRRKQSQKSARGTALQLALNVHVPRLDKPRHVNKELMSDKSELA